jgi:glycosyltransferase involved in cell wall biosynthesis
MRVVHLSTYDIQGGAARASYRLHRGLQMTGIESFMVVQSQTSDDPSVISPQGDFGKNWAKLRPAISKVPILQYRNRQTGMFSPQGLPDRLVNQVNALSPDVINLNWVCDGFLKIETLLKFRVPLIWTLMDQWSFTGGCHYASPHTSESHSLTLPCDRYRHSCGQCPHLQSHQNHDLSHRIWSRKQAVYSRLNLTVISPSQWLAKSARSSSLFRDVPIEVIPYGLDTQCYRPRDSQMLRSLLDLPHDKYLVAFGAFEATRDPRKGWKLLEQAIEFLKQTDLGDRIELVIFGASHGSQQLPFVTHFMGNIGDDRLLSFLYSAVDVMVVPSIQEAFGQTASEALACGTPVVAFEGTGVADIVDHCETGYLTKAYDPSDLAHGIHWVLADADRRIRLSRNARRKAESHYSLQHQSQRYQQLFQKLLTADSAHLTLT